MRRTGLGRAEKIKLRDATSRAGSPRVCGAEWQAAHLDCASCVISRVTAADMALQCGTQPLVACCGVAKTVRS